MTIKVLDLFSGIAGFTLGHEMVGGFETIAFCEKNKFCQKVLSKNFPHIPIIDDVRDVTTQSLQQLRITGVDAICGGLPCQPFSGAGLQRGAEDERNMFPEFFRILRDLQPRWAIIENVKGLLTVHNKWFFRDILWEFSQAGYACQWNIISVASVGGVHRRDRIFIIAYPNISSNSSGVGRDNGSDHRQGRHIQTDQERKFAKVQQEWNEWESGAGAIRADNVANAQGSGWRSSGNSESQAGTNTAPIGGSATVERENCNKHERMPVGYSPRQHSHETTIIPNFRGADARFSGKLDSIGGRRDYLLRHADLPAALPYAADIDDIPFRRERLEALGNSICPNAAAVVWRRVAELAQM